VNLNFYRFNVTWQADRPTDAVYAMLTDLDSYPNWWPDYREMRRIDEDTFEFAMQASLPYKLICTNKFLVREPEKGHFRLSIGGDIVGWIDFVITNEGSGRTRVDITQECRAAKLLLRILAPIGRPAFAYNHGIVMRHGLAGIQSRLPATKDLTMGGIEHPSLRADSLTWKYFGDWRNMLVVLWVGSMQNMHPGLGAAVEQHSQFFEERWRRVFRSFYPVLGVVYDGPHAHETALKVRGYHKHFQGVDGKGHPYHAMAPDVFYWAHAVFFMTTIRFADRFMGGVTERDKLQLFDEHVQLYRLYDMNMRPVPGSWYDFQLYWQHMCANVLEDSEAVRDVLDLRQLPRPSFLRWLPMALWRMDLAVFSRVFVWLTVGLYDPVVRERLGFRWTRRDEHLHQMTGWLIHCVFLLIPHDRRYHPRARAGWRRSRGKTASLVESPARNLSLDPSRK
jgi:uncharacterized protein (DUF2236 family)